MSIAEGGDTNGMSPPLDAAEVHLLADPSRKEILVLRAKLQDAHDELGLLNNKQSQARLDLQICQRSLDEMIRSKAELTKELDMSRAEFQKELETVNTARRRCMAALEEEQFVTRDLRREVSTLSCKLSQLIEERAQLIKRVAFLGEDLPPPLTWNPDELLASCKSMSEEAEQIPDLSTFLGDSGLANSVKLDNSLLSAPKEQAPAWRTMLSQAREAVVAYTNGIPRNEAEFRQLLTTLSELPPTRHAVRGPVSANVERLRQTVACAGNRSSMLESARGALWAESVGNRLQVTEKQFERLCRRRNRLHSAWEESYRDAKEANQGNRPQVQIAKTVFSQASSESVQGFEEEELYLIGASFEQIPLDVNRTFSAQELAMLGSDFSSEELRNLLEAFAVFKPEFGYTQGMNFVAAILLLYAEPFRAFVCFSNAVLLQPWLAACYTFDMPRVHRYFEVFDDLLVSYIPKVGRHFQAVGLNADIFLVEWWFTLFAKSLPLHLTVRLWDMFFLEGDFLLYRASLAILQCFAESLLVRPRDECLALLSSWPARHLEPSALFEAMERLGLTEKRLAVSFERAPMRSPAS